jgi:hypothetical protein
MPSRDAFFRQHQRPLGLALGILLSLLAWGALVLAFTSLL